MDYSMYSIMERGDVSQLFPERMRKEAIFSNELPSDSMLSNMFTYILTEEMHMQFREHWIRRCVERGISEIWLCIDGSNNDCQMTDSDYSEHGENKSHSGKTIVGYIYAVAANTIPGNPSVISLTLVEKWTPRPSRRSSSSLWDMDFLLKVPSLIEDFAQLRLSEHSEA